MKIVHRAGPKQAKKEEETTPRNATGQSQNTAFERFEELAARLLAVPKGEIDAKVSEESLQKQPRRQEKD